MAVFEVIVLGVQGTNNKVHGPGARVTEAHFPEGNAEKLVKEGKLKKISTKADDVKAAKEAKAAKIKALENEVNAAKEALAETQKVLADADEELDKADLITAVENAQLAYDIAVENLKNA